MNQLQISYSLESAVDGQKALSLLVPTVCVDGAPLLQGFQLDMRELAASVRSSGDFWVFVCGCGVPGCGGMERGVVVTHSGDQTRWLVPFPFRRSNPKSIRFQEFVFDAREYAGEVKAALTQARSLAEDFRQERESLVVREAVPA